VTLTKTLHAIPLLSRWIQYCGDSQPLSAKAGARDHEHGGRPRVGPLQWEKMDDPEELLASRRAEPRSRPPCASPFIGRLCCVCPAGVIEPGQLIPSTAWLGPVTGSPPPEAPGRQVTGATGAGPGAGIPGSSPLLPDSSELLGPAPAYAGAPRYSPGIARVALPSLPKPRRVGDVNDPNHAEYERLSRSKPGNR
jgi:hypothetical protein